MHLTSHHVTLTPFLYTNSFSRHEFLIFPFSFSICHSLSSSSSLAISASSSSVPPPPRVPYALVTFYFRLLPLRFIHQMLLLNGIIAVGILVLICIGSLQPAPSATFFLFIIYPCFPFQTGKFSFSPFIYISFGLHVLCSSSVRVCISFAPPPLITSRFHVTNEEEG